METLRYAEDKKAQKEHRCNFCGEKINKGEIYVISTHKHDGEIYDWKSHRSCAQLASVMKMYEDADEGVTEDDFTEHVSSFHDDLLIELLPKENIKSYSDIIQQLRHVNFRYKLQYVVRHFIKLGKIKPNNVQNVQASVARDGDSSTFADTINFLEKIDSASMSDKSWLAEQKNLRVEAERLRERLAGKPIEEVKINYVASERNSD